ncbi:hypothetical protein [Micromonospora avicenniae]|uniref:hypothetical protein n=1 Tax=Micromonospora avicenniae TaxID=1198245 RepID=UPI00343CE41B
MLRAGGLLALGAAAAPLTACDPFGREEAAPRPPDPLRPLLDESLALAAAYRDAATAHTDLAARLNPIAEAHQAHAAELARVLGVELPSAGATPGGTAATAATDADATIADLRQRERVGRDGALTACAAAPAARAALVGSIAAARATHLEALK